MAHCYYHALSSVKAWGGVVTDYQPLHDWFDQSKAQIADFRHRALRHHAEGIFMLEAFFGTTITNSDGRIISAYPVPAHLAGGNPDPTVWIITDDLDQPPTTTTVLFPSDY